MLAVLLILIFIRPFISSLAFPYENFFFSFLFLLFLAAWVVLHRGRLKTNHPLRYPLLSFLAALLISIIFSQNQLVSIRELYTYSTAILLFFIVFSLSSHDKDKIILCIIISGLLVSFFAIYQYFFGFKHLADYVSKQQISDPFILDYISRKRVFSPFVTPTVLGGYLAMILPLTLNRKNKLCFILPLAFALLLTQSLSALLSIFLGMVVYFYWEGQWKKRRVIFLFGLCLAIGLVLMTRITAQKEHFLPFFSTVMRLNYWRETLKIIKTFPLTGVGLGNFNLVNSRYSHNSYLQIWAEMGILGIASFLWLIIQAFKSAFTNLRYNEERNRTLVLMTAGVVFLTHNSVDFTFFLPEVSTLWWLILGLMISKKQTI